MSREYAIRQPDGSWAPCDSELNGWFDRISAAGGAQPLTVIAYDEDAEAHVISGFSYHVLFMALMAMDARLRPERGYRERADEIYMALATCDPNGQKGVQELRRVFRLGVQRPWPVP
jgi:hypothetical protein